MTKIELTRIFDADGYCSSVGSIPEINYRKSIIQSWPNAGQMREYPDDPLYGIISLARDKFRNLQIDSWFSWQIPSQLTQSVRDVLWEYWYKVLLERKRLWPKWLNFTATLDMNLWNIVNAQSISAEIGRSVGKITAWWTTHADKDTPTRVFIWKTTPIVRVISDFDPTKTPRRWRRIEWVFVPEQARY